MRKKLGRIGWTVGVFAALCVPGALAAQHLLVPMDLAQTNHLRAYGLTFWVLERGEPAEWFLNYRGGSFLLPDQEAGHTSAAEELIRRAIERGAPMYNQGNAAACAAVYQTCADALMVMDVLDDRQEDRMTRAMQEASSTHDMNRRAWMMRHALDEAYTSLGEMRTSMN